MIKNNNKIYQTSDALWSVCIWALAIVVDFSWAILYSNDSVKKDQGSSEFSICLLTQNIIRLLALVLVVFLCAVWKIITSFSSVVGGLG